jgi:hypothetical protein
MQKNDDHPSQNENRGQIKKWRWYFSKDEVTHQSRKYDLSKIGNTDNLSPEIFHRKIQDGVTAKCGNDGQTKKEKDICQ